MVTTLKVLGFFALFAIDIPLLIYRGFVLSILWAWFLVPLGLPEIGIAHALGVSVIIGLTYAGLSDKKADPDESLAEVAVWAMIRSFFSSSFAWAVGAIIYWYM